MLELRDFVAYKTIGTAKKPSEILTAKVVGVVDDRTYNLSIFLNEDAPNVFKAGVVQGKGEGQWYYFQKEKPTE